MTEQQSQALMQELNATVEGKKPHPKPLRSWETSPRSPARPVLASPRAFVFSCALLEPTLSFVCMQASHYQSHLSSPQGHQSLLHLQPGGLDIGQVDMLL